MRMSGVAGGAGILCGLLLCCQAAQAAAAEWRPQKNIEIIVGATPGGNLDMTARMIQSFMQQQKDLVNVPVVVVSKPGGNYSIGWVYLNRFPGDGHYAAMGLQNLLTNRITGVHPLAYTDVTPLALLASEYLGFSVRADSPITSGKALIERLRANPDALTIAITTIGSANHIAAALIIKAMGIDPKKVRYIPHKGSAETTVAVAGGHVDVLIATPTGTLPHIQSGKLRMLALTSPRRLAGKMADIPTWKELGVDAVVGNWRVLIGPQGLSAPQVAFWDELLSRFSRSAQWQKDVETNGWQNEYLNSADTARFLKGEYERLSNLFRELDLGT